MMHAPNSGKLDVINHHPFPHISRNWHIVPEDSRIIHKHYKKQFPTW